MVDASFSVHVPATTANLGPGFDCLGLALDLWNKITFSFKDKQPLITINGEGKGELKEDESNLIIKTAMQMAHIHGLSLPKNLHISCHNNIPISSGLGSSASAVIAGLVGAREILGIDINDDALLQTASLIEEHADNVSACLFGGLVLVGNEKGGIASYKLKMKPLTAVIVVPSFSLSTETARKVLPKQIPFNNSVDNIYRAVKLVSILEHGNYEQLETAMSDNLHQNYRWPLLPGAQKAMQSAIDAGAYGSCLSGAGPSVFAFSNQEKTQKIGNAMLQAYREVGLQARIFSLHCPAKSYYLS
jgi:homoserine kinase